LPLKTEESTSVKWAINKSVSLFMMSTMHVCKEIYYYNDSDRISILKHRMMSGVVPEKRWKEILASANAYALSIVKQHVPDFNLEINIPTIPAEPPEYFEAYFNLIDRLTKHPKHTFDILRYIDYILMEYNVKDKEINYQHMQKLFTNHSDVKIAAKAVLHFICHVSKIDISFFNLT
jgi:hypothetical protein